MSLNLIFDEWQNDIPLPNGIKFVDNPNSLKLPHTTLDFFKIKNYKNHDINKIIFDPKINYFYFINYKVSILSAISNSGKLFLSDEMINLLKYNTNIKVIYMCEHEPEDEKFLRILNLQILDHKLNQNQFYVVNNNAMIKNYSEEIYEGINCHYLKFLPKFYSKIFKPHKNLPFVENKEGKFMMCHNKVPKSHRYGLLVLLKKYKILDHVDWSLVMGEFHKKINNKNNFENFYLNVFEVEDLHNLKTEIDYINNISLKKSDYELEKTWFDNDYNTSHIFNSHSIEPKTLINSYVNCITESVYKDLSVHITEKSIKPFFFYQIPIFLSSYKHVEYLKKIYGFDVFDDIINHNYDNIIDHKVRLKKVIEEIKRLFEIKNDIINFYKNNKDRFENNKKIVMDLMNNDDDFNFFQSLHAM